MKSHHLVLHKNGKATQRNNHDNTPSIQNRAAQHQVSGSALAGHHGRWQPQEPGHHLTCPAPFFYPTFCPLWCRCRLDLHVVCRAHEATHLKWHSRVHKNIVKTIVHTIKVQVYVIKDLAQRKSTWWYKGIHLSLRFSPQQRVKPVGDLNTKSSHHWSGLSNDSLHQHHRKRERDHLHKLDHTTKSEQLILNKTHPSKVAKIIDS
jgi:hypothetical protein